MTRALENSLTVASVKVKNGWQHLSIDTLEPKLEQELKRKRSGSRSDHFSDTSSSISDRFYHMGQLDSSPLAAPMFSDDIDRSGSSLGFGKRARYQQQVKRPVSSTHARTRVRTANLRTGSWKSSYKLPESSPVYHTRHAHFNTSHVPNLSFVSATTVADEPASPEHSEDDDEDLPIHSFHVGRQNSHIRSSPPAEPRTPSPTPRVRKQVFNATSRNPHAGEEGADLLMFLAASPSPADAGNSKNARVVAPTTPPSKSTPLPSSMMSTPGGGSGFLSFGAQTPGMAFDFADYLNVTPSPGQTAWARTPVTVRTPLAAKDARRRLNFDALLPPSLGDSPRIGGYDRNGEGKVAGLGMELGGELVSSQ